VGRLRSIDVLRGATVVGMIVVNAAAMLERGEGVSTYPVLLHVAWDGCRPADLVFPFFLLILGISISLASRPSDGSSPDRTQTRQIVRRSVRLISLGVGLNAYAYGLLWLAGMDPPALRVLGVLQRIGLCYLGAALAYRWIGTVGRAALAVAILLAYWPLLSLVPVPGLGAPDLWMPGQNLSAWIDATVLGTHLDVSNVGDASAYDSEGILSTLPAIAQVLLGTLVGDRLRSPPSGSVRLLAELTGAGVLLIALGGAWGTVLPTVKKLWTSSYVLSTTGGALLATALAYALVDVRGWRGAAVRFQEAFGRNAITAYVLHILLLGPLLAGPPGPVLYAVGLGMGLSAPAASLPPIVAGVAVVFVPIGLLYRRRWFIRI